MDLAGRREFTSKLVQLFVNVISIRTLLYDYLRHAPCFCSSKEGSDSLLSKTRRCVSDIIRVCFFEAGRSIAHKCARFLALCIR